MRIMLIIGALLLGLVGLFMSVCGGGFLIRMGYDASATIGRSGHWQDWLGALMLLSIPAVCAAIGASLCWFCVKSLRKITHDHQRDNR
jgi:hypothetical protein